MPTALQNSRSAPWANIATQGPAQTSQTYLYPFHYCSIFAESLEIQKRKHPLLIPTA